MKIKHEERFSKQEMLDMWTWTAKPKTRRKRVMRDTRTRGEKRALQREDNLIDGVSVHKPGSDRVADLAAFYAIAVQMDEPISPFGE